MNLRDVPDLPSLVINAEAMIRYIPIIWKWTQHTSSFNDYRESHAGDAVAGGG